MKAYHSCMTRPPHLGDLHINRTGAVNSPDTCPPDPWAFFDKIYCITLQSRPDRRAQASHQFAAAGILSRVEFVVVPKHPDRQEAGIYQSHQECLRRGLRDNGCHILIFRLW